MPLHPSHATPPVCIKNDTLSFMSHVLDVRFFRTDAGAEPVREWLRDLPAIDRQTIGEDIKTVQFGWPLGMPLVNHLGGEVWEVRIKLAIALLAFCLPLRARPWCSCMASSRSCRRRQDLTLFWQRTG